MATTATPRHERVSSWIRDQIETGALLENDQLPSENQLGQRFGVSRITVRRALQTLESEGLIFRRQGLGSFVADNRLHHGLEHLSDFVEDMEAAGLKPESIVLVTEKPAPPTPDEPGDEIDPGFSSGAAALGIVLGTAGLGYITYAHISSLYLYYTLPGGFIPSTRQELANVLWTTAGKPDPVSTALYTDIPADNIEQQKAARWCVEQGLLSDHGATFGPDTKVTNARIIHAWNSLKKVPVTIQ